MKGSIDFSNYRFLIRRKKFHNKKGGVADKTAKFRFPIVES
jgi:hypothetical protein